MANGRDGRTDNDGLEEINATNQHDEQQGNRENTSNQPSTPSAQNTFAPQAPVTPSPTNEQKTEPAQKNPNEGPDTSSTIISEGSSSHLPGRGAPVGVTHTTGNSSTSSSSSSTSEPTLGERIQKLQSDFSPAPNMNYPAQNKMKKEIESIAKKLITEIENIEEKIKKSSASPNDINNARQLSKHMMDLRTFTNEQFNAQYKNSYFPIDPSAQTFDNTYRPIAHLHAEEKTYDISAIFTKLEVLKNTVNKLLDERGLNSQPLDVKDHTVQNVKPNIQHIATALIHAIEQISRPPIDPSNIPTADTIRDKMDDLQSLGKKFVTALPQEQKATTEISRLLENFKNAFDTAFTPIRNNKDYKKFEEENKKRKSLGSSSSSSESAEVENNFNTGNDIDVEVEDDNDDQALPPSSPMINDATPSSTPINQESPNNSPPSSAASDNNTNNSSSTTVITSPTAPTPASSTSSLSSSSSNPGNVNDHANAKNDDDDINWSQESTFGDLFNSPPSNNSSPSTTQEEIKTNTDGTTPSINDAANTTTQPKPLPIQPQANDPGITAAIKKARLEWEETEKNNLLQEMKNFIARIETHIEQIALAPNNKTIQEKITRAELTRSTVKNELILFNGNFQRLNALENGHKEGKDLDERSSYLLTSIDKFIMTLNELNDLEKRINTLSQQNDTHPDEYRRNAERYQGKRENFSKLQIEVKQLENQLKLINFPTATATMLQEKISANLSAIIVNENQNNDRMAAEKKELEAKLSSSLDTLEGKPSEPQENINKITDLLLQAQYFDNRAITPTRIDETLLAQARARLAQFIADGNPTPPPSPQGLTSSSSLGINGVPPKPPVSPPPLPSSQNDDEEEMEIKPPSDDLPTTPSTSPSTSTSSSSSGAHPTPLVTPTDGSPTPPTSQDGIKQKLLDLLANLNALQNALLHNGVTHQTEGWYNALHNTYSDISRTIISSDQELTGLQNRAEEKLNIINSILDSHRQFSLNNPNASHISSSSSSSSSRINGVPPTSPVNPPLTPSSDDNNDNNIDSSVMDLTTLLQTAAALDEVLTNLNTRQLENSEATKFLNDAEAKNVELLKNYKILSDRDNENLESLQAVIRHIESINQIIEKHRNIMNENQSSEREIQPSGDVSPHSNEDDAATNLNPGTPPPIPPAGAGGSSAGTAASTGPAAPSTADSLDDLLIKYPPGMNQQVIKALKRSNPKIQSHEIKSALERVKEGQANEAFREAAKKDWEKYQHYAGELNKNIRLLEEMQRQLGEWVGHPKLLAAKGDVGPRKLFGTPAYKLNVGSNLEKQFNAHYDAANDKYTNQVIDDLYKYNKAIAEDALDYNNDMQFSDNSNENDAIKDQYRYIKNQLDKRPEKDRDEKIKAWARYAIKTRLDTMQDIYKYMHAKLFPPEKAFLEEDKLAELERQADALVDQNGDPQTPYQYALIHFQRQLAIEAMFLDKHNLFDINELLNHRIQQLNQQQNDLEQMKQIYDGLGIAGPNTHQIATGQILLSSNAIRRFTANNSDAFNSELRHFFRGPVINSADTEDSLPILELVAVTPPQEEVKAENQRIKLDVSQTSTDCAIMLARHLTETNTAAGNEAFAKRKAVPLLAENTLYTAGRIFVTPIGKTAPEPKVGVLVHKIGTDLNFNEKLNQIIAGNPKFSASFASVSPAGAAGGPTTRQIDHSFWKDFRGPYREDHIRNYLLAKEKAGLCKFNRMNRSHASVDSVAKAFAHEFNAQFAEMLNVAQQFSDDFNRVSGNQVPVIVGREKHLVYMIMVYRTAIMRLAHNDPKIRDAYRFENPRGLEIDPADVLKAVKLLTNHYAERIKPPMSSAAAKDIKEFKLEDKISDSELQKFAREKALPAHHTPDEKVREKLMNQARGAGVSTVTNDVIEENKRLKGAAAGAIFPGLRDLESRRASTPSGTPPASPPGTPRGATPPPATPSSLGASTRVVPPSTPAIVDPNVATHVLVPMSTISHPEPTVTDHKRTDPSADSADASIDNTASSNPNPTSGSSIDIVEPENKGEDRQEPPPSTSYRRN